MAEGKSVQFKAIVGPFSNFTNYETYKGVVSDPPKYSINFMLDPNDPQSQRVKAVLDQLCQKEFGKTQDMCRTPKIVTEPATYTKKRTGEVIQNKYAGLWRMKAIFYGTDRATGAPKHIPVVDSKMNRLDNALKARIGAGSEVAVNAYLTTFDKGGQGGKCLINGVKLLKFVEGGMSTENLDFGNFEGEGEFSIEDLGDFGGSFSEVGSASGIDFSRLDTPESEPQTQNAGQKLFG